MPSDDCELVDLEWLARHWRQNTTRTKWLCSCWFLGRRLYWPGAY